jgi:hypothetical protein
MVTSTLEAAVAVVEVSATTAQVVDKVVVELGLVQALMRAQLPQVVLVLIMAEQVDRTVLTEQLAQMEQLLR